MSFKHNGLNLLFIQPLTECLICATQETKNEVPSTKTTSTDWGNHTKVKQLVTQEVTVFVFSIYYLVYVWLEFREGRDHWEFSGLC